MDMPVLPLVGGFMDYEYGIQQELAQREKRAFLRWCLVLAVVVGAYAWG